MQLALPSDSKATYVGRLMIAGVAVAGASLFAMNAPTPTGPLVQHRDVKLAAGEVDWTTFLANVNDNLATLQSEGATSSTELSTALGNVSDAFSTQIITALTGVLIDLDTAVLLGVALSILMFVPRAAKLKYAAILRARTRPSATPVSRARTKLR